MDSKVHISPKDVPGNPIATNLLPSADEATGPHPSFGTLLETQVRPESVEVNSPLLGDSDATNLEPSAEQANWPKSGMPITLLDQLPPQFVET
jgi:hypothetical protein